MDNYVSIHAPVKGATRFEQQVEELARVSIHAPVKGATPLHRLRDGQGDVSIHAPVKGATRSRRVGGLRNVVSIHAPVKGATRSGFSPLGASKRFNPRTREGCDARGGTHHEQYCGFNPRTREGCDSHILRAVCRLEQFQSTHP